MKQHCYKWLPYRVYELDNIKHWLEELAEQGWQLEDIFGPILQFRRIEPKRVQYYIDATQGNLDFPDDDLLAAYQEYGWHHCSRFYQNFHIYAAEGTTVRPIHTDTDVEAMALKRVVKSTILNFVLSMVLALVLIGALAAQWFTSSKPLLELVQDNTAVYLLRWLLAVSLICEASGQFRQIWGYYSRLKAGEHLQEGKKKPHRQWISMLLSWGLIVAYFAAGLLGFTMEETLTLTEHEGSLPFLLLQEVEQGIKPGQFIMHGVDYANYLALDKDLLSPIMMDALQSGNHGQTERVVLETEYYAFTTEFLAKTAYQEYLDEAGEQQGMITTLDGVADQAHTVQPYENWDGQRQVMVLRQGKGVLMVSYGGNQNLAQFAARYAERMTAYQP